MKHGLKCPKCGSQKLTPHRAKAKVTGTYSVRVVVCAQCEDRTVLVTQVITPELAEKIMEEIDEEGV